MEVPKQRIATVPERQFAALISKEAAMQQRRLVIPTVILACV